MIRDEYEFVSKWSWDPVGRCSIGFHTLMCWCIRFDMMYHLNKLKSGQVEWSEKKRKGKHIYLLDKDVHE